MGNKHPRSATGGITLGGVGFNPLTLITGNKRDALKRGLQSLELSTGVILTLPNACTMLNKHVRLDRKAERKKRAPKKSEGKQKNDTELCLQFIAANMRQLLSSRKGREALLSLSKPALRIVLQRDDLVIRSEYEMLVFVFAWANSRANKHPITSPTSPEVTDTTEATAGGKINLRDSAALYSQLSMGAAQMSLKKETADRDNEDDDSESESECDEAEQLLAEMEDETSKRLRELRNRLANTEWASDSSEEPKGVKSDEELLAEEEMRLLLEGGPQIDLRGTAGLFQHMSQGAAELSKAPPPTTEEKRDQETAEVLQLIELIQESEDTEGWELDEIPIPREHPIEGKPAPEWLIANLPREKTDKLFIKRVYTVAKPLLKYIRFPTMSPFLIRTLEEDGIIPTHYITEAWQYQFHRSPELRELSQEIWKDNPRTKRRGGIVGTFKWDNNCKDARVQVRADCMHVVASPNSGCGHKSILGDEGFESGRVMWEVLLNQEADCYSAVGVARKDQFNTSMDILGQKPGSYALGLYPGTHVPAMANRKQNNKGRLTNGDKVRVDLNLDQGTIAFYLNDQLQQEFSGLGGHVYYPAMTVCELSGGGYTLSIIEDHY